MARPLQVTFLLFLCLVSLLPHLQLTSEAILPQQKLRFLGRGLQRATSQSADPKDKVSDPSYSVQYTTQKLDHFNSTETRSFSQRYLVSDAHWDKKGPILVYTGNEGDIVLFFNNTGFVVKTLAQHFNALVLFIEHRYYGNSLPFGAASYKDAKHLAYLTSEQALADFVAVIQSVKSGYKTSSPAIAVGGSYGGMLAAWLRMKYPDIVIGSLASSAPIWWFSDLTPCERAYQTVTRDFRTVPQVAGSTITCYVWKQIDSLVLKLSGSIIFQKAFQTITQDYRAVPQAVCSDVIREVWKYIDNLMKQGSEDGAKALTEIFHLCSPLKVSEMDDLMNWLEVTLFNLAMVDYPYSANFLVPLPPWPVNVTCTRISQYPQNMYNVVHAVAAGVAVYHNSTGQSKCFNISRTGTFNLVDQAWNYQSCTEMVMPMCSDGVNDMFRNKAWNLTAFGENCMKKFGVKPQPDLIKKLYGGKDIANHSNIIFSNGLLDPWSGGGVLESVSESLVAIVIQQGAHHIDLRAPQDNDPPELVQARQREIDIMTEWIKDYHSRQ